MDEVPKYTLEELDGLEDIYDLIKSDFKESNSSQEVRNVKALEKRYRNESYINEGGMKVIEADFDTYCQRKVARAGLKPGNEKIDAFIHEARILARLEHSNIVPLYDLGLDDDDQPYFTMRLLGGENLQNILDKLKAGDKEYLNTYTETYLREVFLKVCDAIAYAHTKDILHLDLKPANIQIDQFGEVLVCDWGLARVVKEVNDNSTNENSCTISLEHSVDDNIKGTPGFMAPEQINKELPRSHQTDVYCLGALFYSILTYESPVEASSFNILMKKTLAGDILSPQKRFPRHKIPDGLNAVVMKSLAVKPPDRYPTVQALINDLRAYNQGFATAAENANFSKLLSLLIKRYKLWFTALIIVLILFTFTVSYFLVELKNEKHLVEKALNQSQASEQETKQVNKKALNLVHALQTEKRERQILRENVAPQFFRMALDQQAKNNFSSAKYLGNYALTLDPALQELRYFVALTHFGSFEFKKCREILGPYSGERDPIWLKNKAKKYDQALPNIDQIHQFINELNSVPDLLKKNLEANLIYTITRTHSLEDRLRFAKLILYKPNNPNSFFDLKRGADGYELSLKNSKTFGHVDCLANLPLTNLDLTNTNVSDLSAISEIPLKKLYLKDTRVIKIDKLNTKHLKIIDLRNTLIANIDFLENSPVEEVYMGTMWIHPKVLKTCENLKILNIPEGRYSLQNLKRWDLLDKVVFSDPNTQFRK